MLTKTKLIFTLSNGSEAKYSLSREGSYTLGSAHSCDITLDDGVLEKEHAKLVADETSETRWFLQNIGDGSISFLEDGTELQIGHTHLQVTITEEEEDEDEEEDEASEDKFNTEEASDNESQLKALQKAQEAREIRSATILIIVCAILSFAAGVAFRLMSEQ